mmetsp:Transcript_24282/g.77942  ORF Transcript_24282/g.77942 Transcript_24282/m.77942 type:complete len:235 (+) Transcript_24282:111-815(+)
MFAHALFSVAAAVTSKAAVPPPIKSVTRARSSSTMQYQQQGGYFEQQGYGQQQQQGYAHQGYGGQQAGPRVLLYGAQGVVGHDKHIYGREREDYTELPYIVNVGDETVLSRWNMMQPSSFVSRVQCIVQVAPDGTPYLYSCGKPATGCRQGRGAPWYWVEKGQALALATGSQICLDATNPEGAVFHVQVEGQPGVQGQQQGQLPYPWEQQVDPQSGQAYYYNPQTGQSQWEAPL